MGRNILNFYYNNEFAKKDFEYFVTFKDINKIFSLISKELNSRIESSIYFVDSKTIKELNREHRNMDKVTDVLSFPHNELEGKRLYIGDIFINLDIIKKQANDIGSDPYTEIKFLSMHGFLHLIGYDHDNLEDEEKMCKRQRQIFTKLKIRNDLKKSDI